jgi:hypothetical protein
MSKSRFPDFIAMAVCLLAAIGLCTLIGLLVSLDAYRYSNGLIVGGDFVNIHRRAA